MKARLLLALLIAGPLFAQTDPSQAKQQAQKYLDQGVVLFDAGDTHGALDNFLEAYRLYPSPKLLVNIAAAYRRLDRPVEAVEAYEKFIREAKDVPPARIDTARKAVKEIEVELGRIAVSAPAGTAVAIDGQPKGTLPLGALRATPGRHKVSLSPPGGREVEVFVDVVAGGTHAARLENGTPVVVNVPEPAPAPAAEPAEMAVRTALSHRGRFGATLRADIEGTGEGGVANVGLTYGLHDRVDVELAALIGENAGVRPGAALFILTGRFKPLVYVGVPIFFTDDGVKPGIHGGVGLLWDPTPRWGLFAGLGVAHHPGVPEPLDKTVFLPSLGVQGRL